MAIERELKFSLVDAPPAAAEVVRAFRGSPFELEPLGSRTHVDRYYDDAGRSLAASGVALRRRRTGATELATLKWAGTVDGAKHEREEIEAATLGEGWPAVVLERLALHLDGGHVQDLRPRLELTVDRATYAVRRGGALVATLMLDDVSARYPDGDHQALFWEAEVEGHDVSVLADVVDRLALVVVLTPSSANKLERAEAMLELGAVL